MDEQTDRPGAHTTDQVVRDAWAEGRVVIQGVFTHGPDKGRTFLVLHPRDDLELALRETLDGKHDATVFAGSIRRSVRAVVDRGINQVGAETQSDFNEDIPLLLVMLLALGRAQVEGAGVDLNILLDNTCDRDVVATAGLDPELIARAPGAVPATRTN